MNYPSHSQHRRRITILGFIAIFLISLFGNSLSVQAKASDSEVQSFANVVLFAHFSDDPETDAAFFADPSNRNDIISMYNGDSARSMKNYFNTISYGKFQVKNIFPQDDGTKITSFELPFTREQATNGNIDYSMIRTLLESLPALKGTELDYNHDGYIDNLTIIVRGGDGKEKSSSTMVSHKSDYPEYQTWSGKAVGTYNVLNTYSLMESPYSNRAGVICHEFLHSLGYPDLYNNSDAEAPVYVWDIMASVNEGMTYPLAYLRKEFSGWLDIETVTESKSLTLDLQSKADGNQAYILKSPLNDQEFFVVEFRKKGSKPEDLDRYIGDSGIIVYRVNTTVTGLSNYHGQTGIYIFRPQEGQTGYSDFPLTSLSHAALSQESGRTEIGSSDMSKTLKDGALTFSDGSNSGIVIKNVSSNSGSTMTLDVEIPEASDFDVWTDTGFSSTVNSSDFDRNTQLVTWNNQVILLAYENSTMQAYTRNGDTWSKMGSSIKPRTYFAQMKLQEYQGNLYLAYSDNSAVKVKVWDTATGDWKELASVTDFNETSFDFLGFSGKLYVSTISKDQNYGVLTEISKDGTSSSSKQYHQASIQYMLGQPKLAVLGNSLYLAICDNGNLWLGQYSVNGITAVATNQIRCNTYDLEAFENKLYFVRSNDTNHQMSLDIFDGSTWTEKQEAVDCFDPQVISSQGELYIMTASSSESGKIRVYKYNSTDATLVQEGEDVDGNGSGMSFVASGDTLYAAYRRASDNKIFVREKTFSDPLRSLSITPPVKLAYKVGDTLDLAGMKVVANYQKESRELAEGQYTISGFDTSKPGEYNATVSFGGISNTFTYQVFDETEVTPGETPNTPDPITEVRYLTHIQDYGWEKDWKTDGEMSGTQGESKRLEGIKIDLGDTNVEGSIEYRTHIQTYGWEKDWKTDGEMSGTSGESKRLEAIQIRLTGELAEKYDVYYRVHAQQFGWMDWAKNGELAGTAGYSYRLEGIEIQIVPKGDPAPGSTKTPYRQPQVAYSTHVQNIGWQNPVMDGATAGTSGQSKRLEAITMQLKNQEYSGNIEYKTHIQMLGWEKDWKKNGAMSGTSGKSYRLEAIQIKLTGEMAEHYDIYYRVHAQQFGWMGWAKNGESAGTAGYSYRLEAIQIVMVPKGSAAPGSTANCFRQK